MPESYFRILSLYLFIHLNKVRINEAESSLSGPPLRSCGRRSRGMRRAAGGGRQGIRAAQYRLYHDRRPCLSDRRRLRASDFAAGSDAQYRPAGARRDAFPRGVRRKLDLGAFAGDPADRRVQPSSRADHAQLRHYGYDAGAFPRTAPGRGLPDGDLRQMAPERRTQGLRSLRPAVGSGGVLQSGDAHARNRRQVRPLWRGSTRAGTTTRLSA